MKKYLLFIITLLLFPMVVYASPTYCGGDGRYTGSGWCNTSYYGVTSSPVSDPSGYKDDYQRGIIENAYYFNGQTAFCIDAMNQAPRYVDRARNLNMNNAFDRGIAAIYRVYLLEVARGVNHTTAFYLADDAMRLFVVTSGNTLGDGYYLNPTEFYPGFASRIVNGSDTTLKLMYCTAAVAHGGISHTSACNSYINSKKPYGLSDSDYMKLIKLSDFNVNLVEDTSVESETVDSTKKYSQEIVFKLTGTGVTNINSVLTSFPKLRTSGSVKPEIKVTSCSLDAASKKAGFTCRVTPTNLIGSDGKLRSVKVIIENNQVILNDTKVNVKLNVSYHFPYDSSGVTVFRCSGSSGACRDLTTQRLIIMDKDKILSTGSSVQAEVPSACKYEVKDGVASYYLSGRPVGEYEYLHAGCCDVNPNYLRDQTAILEYKNYCMENDVVFFENECGTRSKLGTNKIDIGGDRSAVVTTCTNESYVDYTHSYIWQLPLSKVMDRLKRAEEGAYQNDLTDIYSNEGIANYQDQTYVTREVTSDAGTLPAISKNNYYCMLFTSEENNLYFPGTTIASSGRFFVFNELNRSECVNSIEPGANCYRQPYVTGLIDTIFHTNVAKWEKDYLKAIQTEKDAYAQWQKDQKEGSKQLYEVAVQDRKLLEDYKKECEARVNVPEYWDYKLSPEVLFKYKQKVYTGTDNAPVIEDTVNMEISHEGVKYWPRVTTDVKTISTSGSRSNKTYTISYGNVNETKTFDSTTNYRAKFEQTIYYKPDQVAYTTLPTGSLKVIALDEYQTAPVTMVENGIEVGYVYNVKLTTYEGIYSTLFNIDKVGHLDKNGHSNVQKTLDKYKQDNNLDELNSECVYCNQEGEFSRECDVCPDPPLTEKYVYRTVSLQDVTPNDREDTNWSDAKGKSAEARIQSLSGSQIISALDNTNTDVKATVLGDISTDVKTENLAKGDIYDDSSREYLEYEFNLTVKDMQIIKKNSRRDDFHYSEMVMCNNTTVHGKSATANYCFKCNEDGKECQSTFIDAFAESAITAVTRNTKWKYFINNKWQFGKMSTISGFENGRYPDPTNQEAYIKIYSNWP